MICGLLLGVSMVPDVQIGTLFFLFIANKPETHLVAKAFQPPEERASGGVSAAVKAVNMRHLAWLKRTSTKGLTARISIGAEHRPRRKYILQILI